jgi:signal transduction histidine kinase/Na+/proline symporter/CheY-like chemotaxis protein
VCSRYKVTSIADFIGSRYGKSQTLAAIVTIVAVLGSLPYIALQLKAVTLAWTTIAQTDSGDFFQAASNSSTSFITALLMAWFAIVFGTRVIDGPRQHTGMVTAIAVESIVKLVAFVAVAIVAIFWLGSDQSSGWSLPTPLQDVSTVDARFFTQLLLAMAAIVCLPRQFHVMAVEQHSSRDLRAARKLFPLYLILFSVLMLPIAMAGNQLFSGIGVSADSYVLLLPMHAGSQTLTALAFIGGLSAATGMVVVAAVTLSVMISNELVVPAWLRRTRNERDITRIGVKLRLVRRAAIVVLLLLGWLLEGQLANFDGLASIGMVSFAAAAQTLPALVSSLYWKGGHRNGVLSGLLVGISIWFYCLLLPAVLSPGDPMLSEGPLGIAWLSPLGLFGTGSMDTLTHGVIWSLGLNALVFVLVSKRSRFTPLDKRQALAFTTLRQRAQFRGQDFDPMDIEVGQLQTLLQPLLGDLRDLQLWQEFERRLGHRLLPHDPAPRFVVTAVEEALASVVGAVSAHRAIERLRKQQPLQLEDFVSLMGGSSRQLQFSQQLLQTTIETIPQGISVVDENMNLVAWNSRYEEMFQYPERLLYVGCPIASVYRFNAERGYFGDDTDVEATVERRLALLKEGRAYRIEREMPGGRMVEVCGTPMPAGGYVSTYTDITDYHAVLEELEQSRDQLESRVIERTAELSDANASLLHENKLRARVEKELSEVHKSKTRFMAAASHDLLQPVNAARLFVASLQDKTDTVALRPLAHDVNHIDGALTSVEHLIGSLREIARLDSGKLQARREHFPVSQLLEPLRGEFAAMAAERDIGLHAVPCSLWLYSDPQLLRRILQNFLSNALRYTREGKVLLGCRRRKNVLHIEVWDSGPGIAEEDRARIFEEFERLGNAGYDSQQGLGLGLSIASRTAQLLGHALSVDSIPGKGSVFRIAVPVGEVQKADSVGAPAQTELSGLNILCVDNEPAILAGMQSLLEQWGCQVVCAPGLREALQRWPKAEPPDMVLVDYHLDEETGIDLLQALSLHWHTSLRAIVISADNSDETRRLVKEQGYLFIPKPVKPAALRASLRNLSR